jgi:hypothetical protein
MAIFRVDLTSPQSVNSNQFADIPGLRFVIPASEHGRTAAVFLNVPAPYAEGNNFPGVSFGISADDNVIAIGTFTYDEQKPQSPGRKPFTLIGALTVPATGITIEAVWLTIRSSTGRIDTDGARPLASLTAIVI